MSTKQQRFLLFGALGWFDDELIPTLTLSGSEAGVALSGGGGLSAGNLLLEGDANGALLLEGDFSGVLMLENSGQRVSKSLRGGKSAATVRGEVDA